jgi:Sortase domain
MTATLAGWAERTIMEARRDRRTCAVAPCQRPGTSRMSLLRVQCWHPPLNNSPATSRAGLTPLVLEHPVTNHPGLLPLVERRVGRCPRLQTGHDRHVGPDQERAQARCSRPVDMATGTHQYPMVPKNWEGDHNVVSRARRLDRPRAMVIVAALFATITFGATACSTGAVAGSAAATKQVESSSPPAPSLTSKPAPNSTSPLAVEAAPLAKSSPVRLQIASIGVDSKLMELGLRTDGSMEVPPGGFPAGWYTGGPTPGELGPAVIAGHVDWKGPGVFYKLHSLKPGDQVTITRADGTKPVFRITRVEQFPKHQFPTKLVYGNIDHAGLRLITCGGSFNRQSGSYEDDIVAFADLVTTTR